MRFNRPDIRPYQFEPARDMDIGDGDDGSSCDPDPEISDSVIEYFFLSLLMENAG